MFTVLNIGNTRTQWAEFKNGAPGLVNSCPTVDFSAEILEGASRVAASCVVPQVRRRLECEGLSAFWLESSLDLGIDLSAVDVSTLGADRLANIVELFSEGIFPALCIDAGTAVTFELLDEKGAFVGGAIAPGRKIMSASLHSCTAQLPEIVPDEHVEHFPGCDTFASIKAGLDHGFLGIVMEMTHLSEELFGDRPLRKVAIGGDAGFLLKYMKELEYGGADYTLRGIQKAWEIVHR